jgi:sensor histidine kinase YesM
MKLSWLNKKWVIVLVHSLCWIILFSLPFLLRTSYKEEHKAARPDDTAQLYFYIVSNTIWIGLFYLNAYTLLPFVQRTKKAVIFFLMHVLVLGVVFFFHWAFFTLFLTHARFKPANFFIYNIFPYLFILASSTAYVMVLEKNKNTRLLRLKETENLKTELLFLRSQVSPHFMFNVLNNMVALARKKSDLLEPSLIKLSSLMRYMLYETDEQKVPLEKEVEYIQSYIDLQKQRFGKNLVVNSSFENIDGAQEIEPMLLIPFVENAFKHGTGIIENPEINISLKEKNSILQFTVGNKFNHSSNEIKDKNSGIGLNNVKRRLNLLYGKNQSLYISDKNGCFTVLLQINLKNA